MHAKRTRIYWPVGVTRDMPGRTAESGLIEKALSEYLSGIASPGTEITIGWMERTTSLLSSTFLGMLNDVQVINDILQAESEGYDGAVIGPHWDPGLYGAREAARIPVSGPLESATMLAQTIGRRFAVLTVHEGYVPMIERSLRIYGCEGRAVAIRPVRKFNMTYENLIAALSGEDDTFLREFTRTANECISDGADVIIVGGQLFGPVFQRFGYAVVPGTGVPVLDVAACGLKVVETLIALRRTIGLVKSEHPNAPFRTPPSEVVDAARLAFGLANAG